VIFICNSGYADVGTKHKLPPLSLKPVTQGQSHFAVNQVGYYKSRVKIGYLVNPTSDAKIYLYRLSDNTVEHLDKLKVITSTLKGVQQIVEIDFSQHRKPGWYFLTDGTIRSPRFNISDAPFNNVMIMMLRSYYLQRCGYDINDPMTGLAHAACHVSEETIVRPLNMQTDHLEHSSSRFSGGWHDAGDFGRYVATATVSVSRILAAFGDNHARMRNIDLAVPEKNLLGDVLAEVNYELEWLLKMQSDTGLLYRKVAGKKWPSLMPPDGDIQPLFVYGHSTDDTAKFVATMALASRVYRFEDPDKSRKYLQAALKSWAYLENNPNFVLDWEKSDDSGSGPYKSNNTDTEASLTLDSDDRMWALSELAVTTGEDKYWRKLIQRNPSPINIFEWKDPSAMGRWHAIRTNCFSIFTSLCERWKIQITHRAQVAYRISKQQSFRVANNRYIWGSNKMAAEEGIFLAQAYLLNNKREYLEAAIHQLDYIFGANPFSQSFVTGAGERPVRHVSHIYGRGAKVHIPGLLVGGANSLAQAGVAPKNMGQLSYIDSEKSYAVNEYAIDYNASLIGLISLIDRAVTRSQVR